MTIQNGRVHASYHGDRNYPICSVPFHPAPKFNEFVHEHNPKRFYYFIADKENPSVFTDARMCPGFARHGRATVYRYSGFRSLSKGIYKWCRRYHNHKRIATNGASLAAEPLLNLGRLILDNKKRISTGTSQTAPCIDSPASCPSPIASPPPVARRHQPLIDPDSTQSTMTEFIRTAGPFPNFTEINRAYRSHVPYAYGFPQHVVPVVRSKGRGFTVFADGRAFFDPLILTPRDLAEAAMKNYGGRVRILSTLREATVWLTSGPGCCLLSDGKLFTSPKSVIWVVFELKVRQPRLEAAATLGNGGLKFLRHWFEVEAGEQNYSELMRERREERRWRTVSASDWPRDSGIRLVQTRERDTQLGLGIEYPPGSGWEEASALEMEGVCEGGTRVVFQTSMRWTAPHTSKKRARVKSIGDLSVEAEGSQVNAGSVNLVCAGSRGWRFARQVHWYMDLRRSALVRAGCGGGWTTSKEVDPRLSVHGGKVEARLAVQGGVGHSPITHEYGGVKYWSCSTMSKKVDARLAVHGGVGHSPITHEYGGVKYWSRGDGSTTSDKVDTRLEVHGGVDQGSITHEYIAVKSVRGVGGGRLSSSRWANRWRGQFEDVRGLNTALKSTEQHTEGNSIDGIAITLEQPEIPVILSVVPPGMKESSGAIAARRGKPGAVSEAEDEARLARARHQATLMNLDKPQSDPSASEVASPQPMAPGPFTGIASTFAQTSRQSSIGGEENCLPRAYSRSLANQVTNEGNALTPTVAHISKRRRFTTPPKDDPPSVVGSPMIGRLPTELIGDIFSYFSSLSNPIILCWVCHYWRVVAMAMEKLWIHPTFCLGSAFFPNDPLAAYPSVKATQCLEQMCLWLNRARRSNAVSLSIQREGNQYRWRETSFLQTLILPYAHCFRSLEMDVCQGQLASLLDGGSAFHDLEILSLRFPLLDFTRWLHHRGFRNTAPRLRNLIIRSGKTISEPHPISTGFFACFPWAQLTSLNMEDVVLDFWMWRKVMHQSISLRTGRFTLRRCSGRPESNPSVMTRMVSLHIHFLSQVDLKVFRGLNVPEMKSLHIAGYMSEQSEGQFVLWAEQHCSNLRHLTLELNISDHRLLQLLQHLPNLSTLRLHVDFRISFLTTEAILTVIQHGHIKDLQTLALCCNGATRIYKATRPDMFETYVETLVSAVDSWVEMGQSRELQICADVELLAELIAQLSFRGTSVTAESLPSREGGFFVSITNRDRRQQNSSRPSIGVGGIRTVPDACIPQVAV
ncbi:hypothetical protein C8R46DRAFT_1042125 [Mycena filopes]|nr:hypothetical protein C8R46DRAFT_1042125 [Mycena filopes]